jgi:hypothetical protein
MAQVQMTEAEVVKDVQAVPEKVRQGAEVISNRVITPSPSSSQ